MDSIVVSIRIKKDTKSKLEHEGIDVEKSIKEFLIQKAAQLELKKRIRKLKGIVEKRVKPSRKGFAVRAVREDRYVAH